MPSLSCVFHFAGEGFVFGVGRCDAINLRMVSRKRYGFRVVGPDGRTRISTAFRRQEASRSGPAICPDVAELVWASFRILFLSIFAG
jgi:hypothetical protein